MELEKTYYMNLLYDYYGELLTDKQKEYGELYYAQDLSLGEIAYELDVSRQAVYDNIKRTGLVLEKYERVLGLIKKTEKITQLLDEMDGYISKTIKDDNLVTFIKKMKEEL